MTGDLRQLDSIQNGGDHLGHDHRPWAATLEAMRVAQQALPPVPQTRCNEAVARAAGAAQVAPQVKEGAVLLLGQQHSMKTVLSRVFRRIRRLGRTRPRYPS
jgi:hypothetical protein